MQQETRDEKESSDSETCATEETTDAQSVDMTGDAERDKEGSSDQGFLGTAGHLLRASKGDTATTPHSPPTPRSCSSSLPPDPCPLSPLPYVSTRPQHCLSPLPVTLSPPLLPLPITDGPRGGTHENHGENVMDATGGRRGHRRVDNVLDGEEEQSETEYGDGDSTNDGNFRHQKRDGETKRIGTTKEERLRRIRNQLNHIFVERKTLLRSAKYRDRMARRWGVMYGTDRDHFSALLDTVKRLEDTNFFAVPRSKWIRERADVTCGIPEKRTWGGPNPYMISIRDIQSSRERGQSDESKRRSGEEKREGNRQRRRVERKTLDGRHPAQTKRGGAKRRKRDEWFIKRRLVTGPSTKNKEVTLFQSFTSPLSHFHPSRFEATSMFDDTQREFQTMEQFLMYSKARYFRDDDTAEKILLALTPELCKGLGRKVAGFSEREWKKVRREVVREGNIAKFGQNPDLWAALDATGDTTLAEASESDLIYGIGLGAEHRHAREIDKWKGFNLLGKVLMEVREELRRKSHGAIYLGVKGREFWIKHGKVSGVPGATNVAIQEFEERRTDDCVMRHRQRSLMRIQVPDLGIELVCPGAKEWRMCQVTMTWCSRTDIRPILRTGRKGKTENRHYLMSDVRRETIKLKNDFLIDSIRQSDGRILHFRTLNEQAAKSARKGGTERLSRAGQNGKTVTWDENTESMARNGIRARGKIVEDEGVDVWVIEEGAIEEGGTDNGCTPGSRHAEDVTEGEDCLPDLKHNDEEVKKYQPTKAGHIIAASGLLRQDCSTSLKQIRHIPPKGAVTLLEGVEEAAKPVIARWVEGQRDRGRPAVIVDLSRGMTHHVTEKERSGTTDEPKWLPKLRRAIYSLSLESPKDIDILKSIQRDILVVGLLEEEHCEWFNEILNAKDRPEASVHASVDAAIRMSKTQGGLFIDTTVRDVLVEKSTKGGWAVNNIALLTLSTMPRDNREDETTLGEHLDDVLSFWRRHRKDAIGLGSIPVYTGGDLPRAPRSQTMAQSILGYNGNGLRASYTKDDWAQILQNDPDIFCFAETKSSLLRLKRALGGALWLELRNRYPYLFLFPASSPNSGTHGTLMGCKRRPDAWIRGMGVEEFDDEGRVIGAVFGDRVVFCSYAKSCSPNNENLEGVKAYWKAKTDMTKEIVRKGYGFQGFGDLNIIADAVMDVQNRHMIFQGKKIVKPSCTKEEMKILKTYFATFGLVDFLRHTNPGSRAYTYFQSTKDRDKLDGLRLDYIYGTINTWDEAFTAVVRTDVAGNDHLPIEYKRNVHEQRSNDEHAAVERTGKEWGNLNPKVTTESVENAIRLLTTMDEQWKDGSTNDGPETTENFTVRRTNDDRGTIYCKRVCRRSRTKCPTPYLEVFMGDQSSPSYFIADTGADECVINEQRAKFHMGKDYKLEEPIGRMIMEGATGEPEEAIGIVTIQLTIKYEHDGEHFKRKKPVRFWVFEGERMPTLLGIPAFSSLGIYVGAPEDGPPECRIHHTCEKTGDTVMVLKNLHDAEAVGVSCSRADISSTVTEIPLRIIEDVCLQPGSTVLSVGTPDGYDGRTVMSVDPYGTSSALNKGVALQNNLCDVKDGRTKISLMIPGCETVRYSKGEIIRRAVIMPAECVNKATFVRNHLTSRNETNDRTEAPGPTMAGTTTPSQGQQDVALTDTTNKEKPQGEGPLLTKDHDRFFEEERYPRFRTGGLAYFRPTKKERRRLEDIPAYDEEGNKIDTFDEVCRVLTDADDWNTIHEKGTALPVAKSIVEVNVKAGSKKVMSGMYQNDQGPGERKLVQDEADKLVRMGAAEKSSMDEIEYCSRVMLVPKPNGEWRFCVDLRGVNKNVELEHWPLTKVDIRLQGMGGANFFSTLDLPQAFHNIPIAEESRKYFGFMAPNGLHRYKTLPMGFVNSMALFTRLMDMSMVGLGDMVSVYVDDLIVYSKSFQDHLHHLRVVFSRLQKAGLQVNLAKCEFAKKEVPFLGHVVSSEGIKMDPRRVSAIQDIELPDSITKLRSFLGMTSHYRKFIENYVGIALPLSEIAKTPTNVASQIDSDECKRAFQQLKEKLASDTILMHPDLDKQWVISCDASSYGIGCVLQQRIGGVPDKKSNGEYGPAKSSELRPVAYFSKKLSEAEKKSYCIYEKEAYAVIWGLAIACKSYIIGSPHPILVLTDNKALTWLKESDHPGRIGRWQAELNRYNTNVRHRPAAQNRNSDGLSRNPGRDVSNVVVPRVRMAMCCEDKNISLPDCTVSYERGGIIYRTREGVANAADMTEKEKIAIWRRTTIVTTDLSWKDESNMISVIATPRPRRTIRVTTTRRIKGCIRALTRSNVRKDNVEPHLGTGDTFEQRQDTTTTTTNINDDDITTLDNHKQIETKSLEQIAELQREDNTWSSIIEHIKTYSPYWQTSATDKDLPSTMKKNMTSMDKHLYNIYKKTYIVDEVGVLRKMKKLKIGATLTEFQPICIPLTLKKDILRHHHGSPLGGHLGIAKLTPIMLKRYHWPRIGKDIKRWINGCATCQRRKQYRRGNYGTFKSKVSTYPWERACMDLVGPLPESDNHNRYILTIIDTFSRWPIAIPLPNKEASVIAEAIYKNLICIHGCPSELFSDQEHTLMSKAINIMCENLGIKRLTSACYAPWQNGHVERFHRFLGASLSMYASQKKKDWDRWIDCVLFSYRVSTHSQTGESPYRVIYNRDPVLGADLLFQNFPLNQNKNSKNADEITKELYSWFGEIAAKQRILARKHMKKKNDKEKRINPIYKKDDWILIYEPPVTHVTSKRQWRVPRKFQDTLTGPHRIVNNTENDKGEWTVYHMRRKKEELIHKSRIVLYNPWSDDILDTARGSMVPGHDIRSSEESSMTDRINERKYRNGDDVKIGELIAVAYECDRHMKLPFLIARITELGSYKDAKIIEGKSYRSLEGRLYGNSTCNPHGVFRPGWVDSKDNKHYFQAKPSHRSHRALALKDFVDSNKSTYNIILAGFELTKNEKIDATTLRALRDNPYTPWNLYEGTDI